MREVKGADLGDEEARKQRAAPRGRGGGVEDGGGGAEEEEARERDAERGGEGHRFAG